MLEENGTLAAVLTQDVQRTLSRLALADLSPADVETVRACMRGAEQHLTRRYGSAQEAPSSSLLAPAALRAARTTDAIDRPSAPVPQPEGPARREPKEVVGTAVENIEENGKGMMIVHHDPPPTVPPMIHHSAAREIQEERRRTWKDR